MWNQGARQRLPVAFAFSIYTRGGSFLLFVSKVVGRCSIPQTHYAVYS